MKPKIIISGFNLGMMDDITRPIRNGFAFGAGIDIQKEPGILQVSQRLDAMTEAAATNNITDGIRWMVKFSVNNKVYGLGSSGRLYDYDNTQAGKWALTAIENTKTGVGNGMIEFNGALYYASNGYLGKSADGSTGDEDYKEFTAKDTAWHPMFIFGDYLCIGDGKYIATLDSAGTFTATAVDLPAGYRIRCLAVYGNRLFIGTWRGTNIYDQPEAKLFSCSMTQLLSGEFQEETVLKECGIHALTIWKNNLIIFAGTTGNIYAFNGATITPLKSLPESKIPFSTGEWITISPGAVCEYKGNLLFGVSNGTIGTANIRGIFCLDKNLALTSSHILSPGNITNLTIYSIFQAGTNTFYVAYYDGTTTAYSVDEINVAKRITSTALMESQIYSIANEDSPSEINGFELVAKPLATGNSVAVSYKLDNASSWTSWGTITSANQSCPLWVSIGSAKTIQIKLVFTCNDTSNDSPSVLFIKIY